MPTIGTLHIYPLVKTDGPPEIGVNVRPAKAIEEANLFRLMMMVREETLRKKGRVVRQRFFKVDDFQTEERATEQAQLIEAVARSVKNLPKDAVEKAIAEVVANAFSIDPRAIASPNRHKPIVNGRHAVSYLARTVRTRRHPAAMSLKEVGRITHRDHTTVMNSLTVAERYILDSDRFLGHRDFVRKLARAERSLTCVGLRFDHYPPIAGKLARCSQRV